MMLHDRPSGNDDGSRRAVALPCEFRLPEVFEPLDDFCGLCVGEE